jgi:hypothetical protein
MKDKAADLIGQHDDKVDQALDGAGGFLKDRVGHGEVVDQAVTRAKDLTGDGDSTSAGVDRRGEGVGEPSEPPAYDEAGSGGRRDDRGEDQPRDAPARGLDDERGNTYRDGDQPGQRDDEQPRQEFDQRDRQAGQDDYSGSDRGGYGRAEESGQAFESRSDEGGQEQTRRGGDDYGRSSDEGYGRSSGEGDGQEGYGRSDQREERPFGESSGNSNQADSY